MAQRPIRLNTTFYVDSALADGFVEWVREVYVPSAVASGALTDPMFTRLLTEVQPGAEGFAVQATAPSVEVANSWYEGEGERLRVEISERYGERFLYFTTLMEIVGL